MALRIFTGNRTESLLDQLAGVLRESPPAPLAPATIVVQSRGMEKWLCQRLAERLGCWTAFRFPFPSHFLEQAAEALGWKGTEDRLFGKEVVAWRLLDLLASEDLSRFPPLRTYMAGSLEEGTPALPAFQLARRIADTFDQYSVYRPALLNRWSAGEDREDWQAHLWRLVSQGREAASPVAKRDWLFDRLSRIDAAPQGIPSRVPVFGIPVLPRYHLDFFLLLSRSVEVDLFLFNPCREYWHEIRRLKDKGSHLTVEEWEGRYFEEGNRILAALGRHGQRFHRMLLQDRPQDALEEEVFAAAGGKGLLACLQDDILSLRDRSTGDEEGDPEGLPADPADRSLSFHSCHGPLREMEVLHDRLLDLMSTDPELAPHDILVMCPDAQAYAPYVQAVFAEGDGAGGGGRIPISIADLPALGQNRAASVFLSLLDFPLRRFRVSAVLDLLDHPFVRRRFGIDDEGSECIRRWVEGTRIRWGYDAEERAAEDDGAPAFPENSWRAGLDRLLLGYALAEGVEDFHGGVLPWGDIEGKETETLGKLAHFVSLLREVIPGKRDRHSLAGWTGMLRRMTEDFLASGDDGEDELTRLREAIASLALPARLAGYAGEVGRDVVRHALVAAIEGEDRPHRYLEGKATFCSLLPMRSLPFKVIALVGMNDGDFPRRDSTPSFSRLSPDHPLFRAEFGDRSLRDEDRYLFLETLLSARQALVVTWTGQSLRDGSDMPPSVVVTELIDAVGVAVTRHHLQAFDRRYFDASSPSLFSFSEANLKAAQASLSPRRERRFLETSLPAADRPGEISLASLRRFFRNPAEAFLRQALEVRLEAADELNDDREPLELKPLEAWRLRLALLENMLAEGGHDRAGMIRRLRGEGRLPFAPLGEIMAERLESEVAGLAGKIRDFTGGASPATVPVDLCLGGIRLTGELAGRYPQGLLRYSVSEELGARDLVCAWIDHLVFCHLMPGGERRSTLLLARGGNGSRTFGPEPRASRHLKELLDRYLEGSQRPLFFAPRTSLALVESEGRHNQRDVVAEAWEGREESPGESSDPSLGLCFRGLDPFDEDDFGELARSILLPILENLEGQG